MAVKSLLIKLGILGAGKAKRALGGVEKGMGSLAKSAIKAGAAFFGARAIISGLRTSIELSAKFQGVERGFNNLAKSVGFSSQAFNKLQKATDGTMSSMDLMQQANNAMLLGITDSEDQMAEMFDVAQRLASALGKDTAFGIESLVTGLGRQSKLMLDNLGIMVDVGSANEAYAKELGKTVAELTDAEKKQGFVNETMKEARALVANLGEEQLTTRDKMLQMNTAISDMAISFGDLLAPVVTAGANVMTDFANDMKTAFEFISTIDFKKTGQNLLNSGDALMKAFTDTVKAYFDFIPDFWRNAINQIFPVLKKVLNGMIELVTEFASFIWEPIPISAHIMVLKIKKFFVEMSVHMTNKMREAVNNIKEEFNKLIEEWPKISEKIGLVKAELAKPIDMSEATASIVSQITGLKADLEATGMAELFRKMFMGEGEIETQEQFQARLKEIWGDYAASIIELNEGVAKSEEDKGATITVSGKAAEKTAVETKKMTMESAIASGQSAQSVQGAIRDVIKARFASMIAGVLESEITTKGLLGLVTGAAAAAAAMALFENLVPKFAQGGDFVTSGPQMIMVGDNPSGRERVQVTPSEQGTTGGITINISAPLVDETVVENIIPAIERAQRLNLA